MPNSARYLITAAAFASAPAFDTHWVGILVASYGASWLAVSRAEGKLTTSLAEFTVLGLVGIAGSVLLSNDPTAWLTTFLSIFASVYWTLVLLRRLPRNRILDKLVSFFYMRWRMPSELGDNDTLLHRARFTKNPYILAGLLDTDSGVDINSPDRDGYTPLHEAARLNRNPDVLSVLLDHGADINIRSHFGNTPLHAAASRRDNVEVAAVLIDRGADINARDDLGNTPLHEAATEDENTAVVTLLLDHGADAAARNAEWRTPADLAAAWAKDHKRLPADLRQTLSRLSGRAE